MNHRDKVTAEEGERRERELYEPGGFWNMMITSGSKVKRHDSSPESAQNLILDLLDNEPTTIKLQDEIASGKALIDTDAGASINEEILRLQKEHNEDLEAVKEEMAIAMKQGNVHMLCIFESKCNLFKIRQQNPPKTASSRTFSSYC